MERLTHSRIASFKQCRKRHWFEYEIRLRKERDSKALRMGSAFHEGLDRVKRGESLDDACQFVRACYDDALEQEDLRDWALERETIVALLVGWHWRWQAEPLAVVASEQVFDLPLLNPDTGRPSTTFTLAGKIDGIVLLPDGRLAVLEHKTVSESFSPDAAYRRRLFLDHQLTLYIYAARRLGYQVDTCLYDVSRKPCIKPSNVPVLDADGVPIVTNEQGERVKYQKGPRAGQWRVNPDVAYGYTLEKRPVTPEEWCQSVVDDIVKRPEWYFGRIEVARLDGDIDDFLCELWEIQKTLRDAQLTGRWFKTVARDTCTFCPYLDLCISRWDHVHGLTPNYFHYVAEANPELAEVNHEHGPSAPGANGPETSAETDETGTRGTVIAC